MKHAKACATYAFVLGLGCLVLIFVDLAILDAQYPNGGAEESGWVLTAKLLGGLFLISSAILWINGVRILRERWDVTDESQKLFWLAAMVFFAGIVGYVLWYLERRQERVGPTMYEKFMGHVDGHLKRYSFAAIVVGVAQVSLFAPSDWNQKLQLGAFAVLSFVIAAVFFWLFFKICALISASTYALEFILHIVTPVSLLGLAFFAVSYPFYLPEGQPAISMLPPIAGLFWAVRMNAKAL